MPHVHILWHVNGKQPSGHELKVERVSARVKAKHIAEQMGVTPSRVSSIEREQFPSADLVHRYREALGACQNVPHGQEAA